MKNTDKIRGGVTEQVCVGAKFSPLKSNKRNPKFMTGLPPPLTIKV